MMWPYCEFRMHVWNLLNAARWKCNMQKLSKRSPSAHHLTNQACIDTHTHNCFTALFRDHPGEPVPEENFWTLWCKGRFTEADTQTIRLGATPSRLNSAHLHHPPIFCRPDALSAAQPTVSKHWRHISTIRGKLVKQLSPPDVLTIWWTSAHKWLRLIDEFRAP